MENRTAEEKIQARLRELTDELRQLRRELTDEHLRRRPREIARDQPRPRDPGRSKS